jgi:hypothetical protein
MAGLRTKKSCRTAIADLQNWTSAIPQLSVIDIFVLFFIEKFSFVGRTIDKWI